MKMAAKVILALCASALLVQTISGQCLGRVNEVIEVANIGYGGGYGWPGNGLVAAELGGLGYGAGLAGAGLGYGLAGNGLATGYGLAGNGLAAGYGLAAAELAIGNSGGALPISSASRFAPTGLSVASENLIEGPLAVSGQLPFLAAVALEGQVPSAGVGGVSYGCGNGNIGIVSEGLAGAELAYGAGLGYGAGLAGAGLGYGAGLAGAGLGYGAGLAGGLIGRGGCGCGGIGIY